MPKVIKSININNSFKSRLDDLNKDYFRYIKGTVNRAEIKANELFFTKFIEPRIYADTFLRHAININTQYNEKKILYLNSKIYNKLLDRESELFMHPLIGRKLYKTDTELVLEFNVMTTKLYKIFYDQWSSKSVNVLKFNDKQGVVKSSIIIHIVKNIIENKDFFNGLNDKKYVYNIKWEEILNKLRNDPELIKQLGGDDIVDKMKFVYIKHAKEYGNLISFYADRVYISIDDFLVSGDNYNLKLQNAEE